MKNIFDNIGFKTINIEPEGGSFSAVAYWRVMYNEQRTHDALGGLSPRAYLTQYQKNYNYELST